jgi:hypothetical protein
VLLLVLEDQVLQVDLVETAAIQLLWVLPQLVVAVVHQDLLIQVIQAVLEAAQRIGTTLVQRLAVLEQLDKDMQAVQSQLQVEIVVELVAEVRVQLQLHPCLQCRLASCGQMERVIRTVLPRLAAPGRRECMWQTRATAVVMWLTHPPAKPSLNCHDIARAGRKQAMHHQAPPACGALLWMTKAAACSSLARTTTPCTPTMQPLAPS